MQADDAALQLPKRQNHLCAIINPLDLSSNRNSCLGCSKFQPIMLYRDFLSIMMRTFLVITQQILFYPEAFKDQY